jgi:hypothetical protein
MTWTMLCKRTNDPKLAWIQQQLQARGIPSRRQGDSWHAPILQVPDEHVDAAWAFLGERWKRTRYIVDDIRDEHPDFAGATEPREEIEENELELLQRAGLSRGQP